MMEARTATTTVGWLLPFRLFLAVAWMRAGAEKLFSPQWWIGDELLEFLAGQRSQASPFFRPVMEHVIAPTAALTAIVVMATQLWCGVAIALGKHLRFALTWGIFLNVTFILAGRVTPSVFYLVMQAVLLVDAARPTGGRRAVQVRERPNVSATRDRVL